MYIWLGCRKRVWFRGVDQDAGLTRFSLISPPPLSQVGLCKIFVCIFEECALFNTILGIQHLVYCNPLRCMLRSMLRSIQFPSGSPVLPFNIQCW